jgi:hypothetical protein
MFDAPCSKKEHPEAAAAGKKAFGTLLAFLKNCQDEDALPGGDI